MKSKLLKKLCAISLAAVMLAGAGVGLADTGVFSDTAIKVSAATSGKYEYENNSDGTITLTSINGAKGQLVIPSKIDGLTVSAIGDYSFGYNYDITELVIPDTVKKIDEYAFSGCRNLSKIYPWPKTLSR